MKNKILLFSTILVMMALIVAFGFTNARYFSTALMTGDINNIKNIGNISIYHPEWIGGYTGSSDGSGVFKVESIPTQFNHIHYVVTNSKDGVINENATPYYIRVVAEDGSNNLPIEYNVHEYNNSANIYNEEFGVGYGPFVLSSDAEVTQEYSLRVNCPNNANKLFYLKVQMVRKLADGSIKVLDEAPLNIEIGSTKTKANFVYFLYGTTTPVGSSQMINFDSTTTVDFKNQTQLNELGITIPDGYTFHDVRHNINGANEYSGTATSVTIPVDGTPGEYYVEVYLVSNSHVAVYACYYDSGTQISCQTIIAPRGLSINILSESERKKYGLDIPIGYTLKSGSSQNTPIDTNNSEIIIYKTIEVTTTAPASVKLNYYDVSNNLIGTETITEVQVGTIINFGDYLSLSSLGIHLPSNYTFKYARCLEIDSTGGSYTDFTINEGNKTYNIDVYLEVVTIVINVPVKFYNSSGTLVNETTVTMKSDGTYDFTTANCRILSPGLSSMTSFTIYIANQWGSTYDNVGNTTSGTVTVDYNKTYTSWADFKLTDEGSYIYIKAWW